MPRLVTKFKYLKPGGGKSAGGYAKYIATREGVERIDESWKHGPATKRQEKLIAQILKDFPDAKELPEYADYLSAPTLGNASEFLSRAMEDQALQAMNRKTYADYIATRPRAERFGSHGLFTDDGEPVRLEEVSRALNAHRGNVWTGILSLRREDAERLGYNTGSRWRDLLRSQRELLAENLKIPSEHLRWYAAFHNEGHHPHVHVIAYSTVPGEGYLTERGVENLRSAIAKELFSQDLVSVYEKQTAYRDELRQESREQIRQIVERINREGRGNSQIEECLRCLARRLSRTSGKKVYGYLKADVKAMVDNIVSLLAQEEPIRQLYDLWYEQRENVLRTYTDTFPERVPLERNKAFKAIRNAVIQEAMKIAELSESKEVDITMQESASGVPASRAVTIPASLRLLRDLARMIQSQAEDYQPRQMTERKALRAEQEKRHRLGIRG